MPVKLYANVNVLEVGDIDFADGYPLYDARYVQKTGDTMTGPLLIHGSANALQLRVKGHSTQSANLQEWQSNGGAVLSKIAADGALTIGSSSAAQTYIGPSPSSGGYHYELVYINSPADALMNLYWSHTDSAGGGVHYILNAQSTLLVSAGYTASQMNGLQFFLTKAGAGEVDYLRGAIVRVEAAGSSYSSHVIGLNAFLYAGDTAYLVEGIGINISGGKASGATFDNMYGIYIQDINFAATTNYALYTNAGDIRLMSTAADKIGFHGAAPIAQQTVTGSRAGNAALTSLLTKLANLGLITDSST